VFEVTSAILDIVHVQWNYVRTEKLILFSALVTVSFMKQELENPAILFICGGI
jgi:hypothetical protein